jgi:DNA-binding beta-propeller fold protein YncE
MYKSHHVAIVPSDATALLTATAPSNQAKVNVLNEYIFERKWSTAGVYRYGPPFTPQGVAVDTSGNVYVTDEYNDRIQKFSSDGTFITKWGSDGSANGQFEAPHGVAVDSSGNVYVADVGNSRVQVFVPSNTSR